MLTKTAILFIVTRLNLLNDNRESLPYVWLALICALFGNISFYVASKRLNIQQEQDRLEQQQQGQPAPVTRRYRIQIPTVLPRTNNQVPYEYLDQPPTYESITIPIAVISDNQQRASQSQAQLHPQLQTQAPPRLLHGQQSINCHQHKLR